ncbi:hypothetical protein [Tomitella biformata]|uniref:hypothetical protein n=1 Tax=Tomitella biformata TaxID=630403 RepID=UPI0004633E31|nr:hypothetical protein [Tomitella biformata]
MSETTVVAKPGGIAAQIGDPGAAALFTFGLALSWVWVAEVIDHSAAGALVFGLLVGGIGQTLGGIIAIIRRDNYLGNLLLTYGIWLIGFHLLSVSEELGNTNSRAWWSFALVIPSLFLMVPAIRERSVPIILAFIFLITLEVFLGLALLNTGVGWLPKAVGWSAFASAFPIYFLAYERLMKAVEPAHAPAVAEFDAVESRGHAG